MVVIDRAPAGLGNFQLEAPFSRTAVWPGAKNTVANARREAGNWTVVAPAGGMRGLGAFSLTGVPLWAWGVGGVLLGGAAVYFLVR